MEMGKEGPSTHRRVVRLQLSEHGHTGRRLRWHLLHTRVKTTARAEDFSDRSVRFSGKSFFFYLGACLLDLF